MGKEFVLCEGMVNDESRKRELKTRPIYECRCDERLETKSEKSTRLRDLSIFFFILLFLFFHKRACCVPRPLPIKITVTASNAGKLTRIALWECVCSVFLV